MEQIYVLTKVIRRGIVVLASATITVTMSESCHSCVAKLSDGWSQCLPHTLCIDNMGEVTMSAFLVIWVEDSAWSSFVSLCLSSSSLNLLPWCLILCTLIQMAIQSGGIFDSYSMSCLGFEVDRIMGAIGHSTAGNLCYCTHTQLQIITTCMQGCGVDCQCQLLQSSLTSLQQLIRSGDYCQSFFSKFVVWIYFTVMHPDSWDLVCVTGVHFWYL